MIFFSDNLFVLSQSCLTKIRMIKKKYRRFDIRIPVFIGIFWHWIDYTTFRDSSAVHPTSSCSPGHLHSPGRPTSWWSLHGHQEWRGSSVQVQHSQVRVSPSVDHFLLREDLCNSSSVLQRPVEALKVGQILPISNSRASVLLIFHLVEHLSWLTSQEPDPSSHLSPCLLMSTILSL